MDCSQLVAVVVVCVKPLHIVTIDRPKRALCINTSVSEEELPEEEVVEYVALALIFVYFCMHIRTRAQTHNYYYKQFILIINCSMASQELKFM